MKSDNSKQDDSREMTAKELRANLAEQMRLLKKGETTAATCNAMCNAVGKIIGTVRLELEYCKMVGGTPKIDFLRIESKPSA